MNAYLSSKFTTLNNQQLTSPIINSFSMLKDGLSNAIEKTHNQVEHMVAPVNNFLKDLTEMEHEFRRIQQAEHEFRICLNGTYVAASDVLQMPMEENY